MKNLTNLEASVTSLFQYSACLAYSSGRTFLPYMIAVRPAVCVFVLLNSEKNVQYCEWKPPGA
jgi:hypothetical protein